MTHFKMNSNEAYTSDVAFAKSFWVQRYCNTTEKTNKHFLAVTFYFQHMDFISAATEYHKMTQKSSRLV